MRILAARWLLPISAPPVENAAVAVEAGEIRYAGPRNGAPRGDVMDYGDAILLPGLVNAHTHLDLTVLRGCIPHTEMFPWIRALVETKAAISEPEILYSSACVGIAEGIRAGITTYADTADSDASLRAMCRAGVRGLAFQEVFGPDDNRAPELIADFRARVRERIACETPLVKLGVSPHAPYTVSDALYREVATMAHEMGLPVAVHIAESAAELEYVTRGSGPFADLLSARGLRVQRRASTPVRLIHENGLLGPDTLLIHCVRASDADIALIGQAGAPIAHCPVSNARLGNGSAPLHSFLEAGVRVGIGTDSMISHGRMDMIEEGRAALLLHAAISGIPGRLGARRMVHLLTQGGADALGLGAVVGSLDAGKRADIAVFAMDGLHATPAFDPYDCLLHSLSGADVRMVMVDGNVLLESGTLAADIAREREVVYRAAARLAAGRDNTRAATTA